MEHDDISYYCIRSATGQPFGLRQDDRLRHCLVLGKTGTGKSTLLRNLLAQDFHAGRGAALLDPHGDLAFELLDHIPRHRTRDVVNFSPADLAHPIGFNVLEQVPTDARAVVADGVVSAFKQIWRSSWGPRLEHILYNAVAALLDTPGSTLLGIPKMLTDERYRERIVRRVTDPVVRTFWRNEFEGYDARFTSEATAPVLNKVGRFLSAPAVRNIVGQPKSTIDFRFMMDTGRLFIANLSKGKIGEEHANLLGALITTKFQLAAMSRTDLKEDERHPFHLVVDEFQNYATDTFASMLSEARKYRLSVATACQFLSAVKPEIRSALLGNVGTLIVFRIGSEDAPIMCQELAPLNAGELTELRSHHIWTRPLIAGNPAQRFPAETLAPLDTNCGRRDMIIAQSRERFGRRRMDVERGINSFLSGT